MDVYFVRHAVAYEREAERWPDDRQRPLTPDGERKFRAAARRLRRLAPSVDLVLCSSFTRAWQTACILEEESRWPAPVACPALEVGGTPKDVLKALAPHADLGSIVLVGHEPSLHEHASYFLLGDAAAPIFEFKKGGVAKIRFDTKPAPGGASLLWLLAPKIFRDLKA